MDLQLTDVSLRSIAVSEMSNNVYLLTSATTGQQVIIDAADDVEAIESLVDAGAEAGPADAAQVTDVLTTHRHWDHVRALKPITEESGQTIDQPVAHGETLSFDGFELEVIELRGHTPGSVAYVLRDSGGEVVIFSGDSLFPGGPGKTWSSEDFGSLMDDLEERIFGQFGDEAHVLPGHGDATTVGAERPQIPEWRERGW